MQHHFISNIHCDVIKLSTDGKKTLSSAFATSLLSWSCSKQTVTSSETPLSVSSLSLLLFLSRLPAASLWVHHHSVSMATAARAERAVLC